MRQFILNIIISMIWAFLHTSYTASDFLVGFVLGAILICLFSSTTDQHSFYLVRVCRILKLALIFLIELVKACFQVLYQVLQPELKIKPGIIKMDISLESPEEIALLANMITLTPGTLTVEVAHDNKALYIHTLVIDDAHAICQGIRNSFEANIKKVKQ